MNLIIAMFFIASSAKMMISSFELDNPKSLEEAVIEPAKFSSVTKHNFNVNIENSPSTLYSNIKSHILQSGIDDNALNTIAQEIYLAKGIDSATIRHLRWDLKITPDIGTLSIYSIRADVSGEFANMDIRHISVYQEIPALYETKKSCSSGNRRYGLFGPRTQSCNEYQIRRGLYGHEVDIINNILFSKVLEATNLLE